MALTNDKLLAQAKKLKPGKSFGFTYTRGSKINLTNLATDLNRLPGGEWDLELLATDVRKGRMHYKITRV